MPTPKAIEHLECPDCGWFYPSVIEKNGKRVDQIKKAERRLAKHQREEHGGQYENIVPEWMDPSELPISPEELFEDVWKGDAER